MTDAFLLSALPASRNSRGGLYLLSIKPQVKGQMEHINVKRKLTRRFLYTHDLFAIIICDLFLSRDRKI